VPDFCSLPGQRPEWPQAFTKVCDIICLSRIV
jgi:hypothetical protein